MADEQTFRELSFDIDIRSESDGRVSMNRFTFGFLVAQMDGGPSLIERLFSPRQYTLSLDVYTQAMKVWNEAYKEVIK